MQRLLATVRTWGEMIKFSHSIFALPFALLATFLAARPSYPRATVLLLILLCMVAARSAAMTFNRIVDLRYDAQNPRTASRPLPTGRISLRAAWAFYLLACAAFIVCCAGFWLLDRNGWPLTLSVPVLIAVSAYSYTKRFTRWSHLLLGAAIAFSPVAAWIAVKPATLGPPAWLLMLAVAFWIGGFDIIYACQDVEFDRRAGLYSLPATIGVGPALWVARGFHLVTVTALLATGYAAHLGMLYLSGLGCVAVILAFEHLLVRADDLSRVNVAFFTLNGLVGLLLGGLGILDICLGGMS